MREAKADVADNGTAPLEPVPELELESVAEGADAGAETTVTIPEEEGGRIAAGGELARGVTSGPEDVADAMKMPELDGRPPTAPEAPDPPEPGGGEACEGSARLPLPQGIGSPVPG
jgi:hypothetical protein